MAWRIASRNRDRRHPMAPYACTVHTRESSPLRLLLLYCCNWCCYWLFIIIFRYAGHAMDPVSCLRCVCVCLATHALLIQTVFISNLGGAALINSHKYKQYTYPKMNEATAESLSVSKIQKNNKRETALQWIEKRTKNGEWACGGGGGGKKYSNNDCSNS